jgi:hypothetical protein
MPDETGDASPVKAPLQICQSFVNSERLSPRQLVNPDKSSLDKSAV